MIIIIIIIIIKQKVQNLQYYDIYISQNTVFVPVLSTDIHCFSMWFPCVTRQIVSWIGRGGTIT